MKLIFLDIDGVLNYSRFEEKAPSGCIGIDLNKVELLKNIVEETGAKIILTSTWKKDWFITDNVEELNKDGRYLIQKLSEHKLSILDKIEDYSWHRRGQGIIAFLEECYCESFVILDDELFDYIDDGLDRYLVKTSFTEGLTSIHVERAIKVLKQEKNTFQKQS